jgi:glycosyltransferase involved in cell wall biosynthesis
LKNVLLLAFYFPPRNHIASYRSGCFAKFLPENGWLPTVICEDWPADRADYDPHFVGVIPPEVEIHRVPRPPLSGFYEQFVLRKIAPYIWPQRAPIRWWQRARGVALELTRQKRFDAIWATSDPLTPLALAAELAEKTGLPWVADIRDSFNVQRFGSWYKRPFFARQERRLSAKADHVVAVSEGLASGLGRLIGKEVTVINNGFDETLLPASRPAPTPLFTLVYAGNLFLPRRDPSALGRAVERCAQTVDSTQQRGVQLLLRAVELCVQRNLIPLAQIEIQFYGTDASLLERAYPGAQTRLPVKVLPRIPHQEILAVQMASSVLLLVSLPSQKGVLTGKVFDYLAAGRPILAAPDDQGEIAALLRRTGAGVALSEVEEIILQLTDWYAAWKTGRPLTTGRNETEIARYSRRVQAQRLAGILNEISGPSKAVPLNQHPASK